MTEIIHKDLSYAIVGAAMEVHKILGPGFLELVYESALAYEFDLRGIPYERQKRLSVSYKDKFIGDYIADMVIANQVILELKAVSAITPAHEAPGPSLHNCHRSETRHHLKLRGRVPTTKTHRPLKTCHELDEFHED